MANAEAIEEYNIEMAEVGEDSAMKNEQTLAQQSREIEGSLREQVRQNPQDCVKLLELVKCLFHQKKYQESISYCNQILSLDPQNPSAYCILGRIYGFGLTKNDMDNSEMETMIHSNSDKNEKNRNKTQSSSTPSSLSSPARTNLLKEEAKENSNTHLTTTTTESNSENDISSNHNHSDTTQKAIPKRYRMACEFFEKALTIDATYAKAHYFYAYLLRSKLNEYAKAEEHYRKAMELRPDDVTSYNDCAIMLVRERRFAEAKQLYEKVLQLKQGHAIAHFNLANLLRKDLKDYNAAEHHFLQSIKQKPKFTAALNNYATMLHHQLRRYNEAENYYLEAIRVDSQYARAHFNYANLCREHLRKYDVAEEHYLLALENDENNPNFHNNYGLLLQYSLKNYREAKIQYEEALRLDPDHALGHCNYATILMQMVDKKYNVNMEDLSEEETNRSSKKLTPKKRELYLQKSEKHFKESMRLNPQLVMAYNNYGCLLRRLERFNEALQMFEKALEIDPKFSMAKRNLNRTLEMMGSKPSSDNTTNHHTTKPSSEKNSNGRNIQTASNNNKEEKCLMM